MQSYLQSILSVFSGFTATHWVGFVGLVGFTIAIIVVDVPLAINRVEGDTFSEQILLWSRVHILVPGFAGTVCGHWFWPGRIWLQGWETAIAIGIAVIALCLLDLAHTHWNLSYIGHWEKNPQEVFLFFFYFGHVVWAQPI